MTGTARIIRGNALALPLPDASVDLVCTSPPYFGLRSYQDDGAHYAGQIGSEPTPAEFIDALIAATREMVRVLKPSGSIFVNLGDKYAGGRAGSSGWAQPNRETGERFGVNPAQDRTLYDVPIDYGHIPAKSLMGMPWRYALRCIDDLGLILRAEIIWAKPNGLPESVTDRVRRSHEQWFHLVKQPRYFSAVDEIRDEYTSPPAKAQKSKATTNGAHRNPTTLLDHDLEHNPLGKLPGSVWSIPTQPLTVPPELGVDHFAAFPMEWPRRIIQGWSPAGVCTVCGEGRRPVGAATYEPLQRTNGADKWTATDQDGRGQAVSQYGRARQSVTITGYACACPAPTAPTRPAVILDPFGGTGTTALVAKALGRNGISVDMSADYCRPAEWRCNDPGQMAAALQVERPDPVSPDQMGLFDLQPTDA